MGFVPNPSLLNPKSTAFARGEIITRELFRGAKRKQQKPEEEGKKTKRDKRQQFESKGREKRETQPVVGVKGEGQKPRTRREERVSHSLSMVK